MNKRVFLKDLRRGDRFYYDSDTLYVCEQDARTGNGFTSVVYSLPLTDHGHWVITSRPLSTALLAL